ncbi:MAG: translocation/assembly module TamB domain-containing protein [Bacteroidales bacterium]|nr:translocation/assembly module TamB domain-containing protein [Bacteroidales bacterium]
MKGKAAKYSVRRVLGAVFTAVYIFVALLNSTVVQSYIGAAVGYYFSKEWGGKVRIGALHASPFSHVILDKIELISPTNDTIYCGDRITCRFKRFPFHGDGLSFDRVSLRNGRYHLQTFRNEEGRGGINLDFIIRYFAERSTPDTTSAPSPFTVEVGELRLHHVDYIQDLPEPPGRRTFPHGVDIPHMRFRNICGVLRNIYVLNDHVRVRIVSLSTTEASGLHIVDLSMDAEVSPHGIRATNMDLQTDDSRVFMDARLDFDGWDEMGDYCNTVVHDVVLKEGTEVNLYDAAYWAPTLWGINSRVAVQGHLYGPVADMRAEHLTASFGESSNLFMDARITGLPDINHTRLDVVIHRLHTTYGDLAAVQHPEPIKMHAPDLVRQMAIIDLNGSVTGGLRDCEAWLNVNSLAGDVETHARLAYDTVKGEYAYWGDVDSRWIGLHALLPNEWVSRTGMHLSFQGSGLNPEQMEATVEGRLYNTVFRGHTLGRATFSAEVANGILAAEVGLNDSLIGLDLSASANLADNSYQADLLLDDAHLTTLNLVKSDSSLRLSTRLHAHVRGKDAEHLTGSLSMDNTLLQIGRREVEMKSLQLVANEAMGKKQLAMDCDWMHFAAEGWFAYKDFPLMVQDFCRRFLPTYYNPYRHPVGSETGYGRKPATGEMLPAPDASLSLEMVWHDEGGTFANLFPNMGIADGTRILGNYNPAESLKMVLTSDSLRVNSITMHDVGVDAGTVGESYRMNLHSNSLTVGTVPLMNNMNLTAGMGRAISTMALKWGDRQAPLPPGDRSNCGDLELVMTSTTVDNRIMITQPNFYVLGGRWSVVCPSGLMVNNERLQLNELKVYGMNQSVTVNAYVAHDENDYVSALFKDFSMGQVCTLLLADKPIGIEGTLDGQLSVKGLNQTPRLDANLSVDNFVFNGQPLGDMTLDTRYSIADARIDADIVSRLEGYNPIELHGYLSTVGKQPKMDFLLQATALPLRAARPFLSSVAENINGTVDATIHAGGTLEKPDIEGTLALHQAQMQIAPTGVTYFINDSVTLQGRSLRLDNLCINDSEKNQARVNGILNMDTPGGFLDLQIHTDRLMMLNKPAGSESFYGKLMTRADGTVSGPLDKLLVAVQATAVEGSDLYVPISNRKQVSENEFIVFISPTPSQRRRATPRNNTPTGKFSLQANVSVTPGVTVHLPMDFEQLTAYVTAVGRGDIQVTMQGGKEPNILGNYEFTSGNFSLSLLQLINKNFDIEEGSTLNFPGNIDDARFNINAVYNQRVNLASLTGNQSTSGDTYVQVQDVITLAGTLRDPAIRFDIRLPYAEQSVNDQVFSYIDRTNERDILNQSISLLLLGRFSPAGTAEGNDNPLSDGSSINLLTSSASSLVSNLVKVVDVNFKYQAGTGSNMGQIDVGISKQWEKFYFESTFGYGNTPGALDNNTANVLVGDVEVGYKFNPFFHFYGFHRSNTSYYTRTEMPYKQGVGIKLSKDFDNISELFPWLRRRKKM